jgi:hypothetical protein
MELVAAVWKLYNPETTKLVWDVSGYPVQVDVMVETTVGWVVK